MIINIFTILSIIFICLAADTFILFSILENKVKKCKDTKHLLHILKEEDKILYLLLFFVTGAFLFTNVVFILILL